MYKRQGEIRALIADYVAGAIPDYQMSALLMAIYFRGMTARETTALTLAMAASGGRLDLSGLGRVAVDKHSTGGVGDTTTLIAAPLAAACGLAVAKMSGRGLGHTGGTLDKLESIPGFDTHLSRERFLALVAAHNLAVTGQGEDLVPADRLLYALRDEMCIRDRASGWAPCCSVGPRAPSPTRTWCWPSTAQPWWAWS